MRREIQEMQILLYSVFFTSAIGRLWHEPPQQTHKVIYKPSWKDLDQRPLPEWYDKAKIGIMVQWGIFSVPALFDTTIWNRWRTKEVQKVLKRIYRPDVKYPEFAHLFTATFFDPDSWAELFDRAGAKYIILTSKHHDGFTLFPANTSVHWNAYEIGAHRDLVHELGLAVEKRNLEYGVYYSLYEWFSPLYVKDRNNNFRTKQFVNTKVWPEIIHLVNTYLPSILWADIERDDIAADCGYWHCLNGLVWLYNESPVRNKVVVNDRWAKGTRCHHGDFHTCGAKYNPYGQLHGQKWENSFPLDRASKGFRRNMTVWDVLSIEELIKTVVKTVSLGGNVLINIGPTKEGVIPPVFQERLLQLGDWLQVNGEAIYSSSPFFYQNDSVTNDIWYTCTKTYYDAHKPSAMPANETVIKNIYAVFFTWPIGNFVKLRPDLFTSSKKFTIRLLGQPEDLIWSSGPTGINILLPDKAAVNTSYAWTLKIIPIRSNLLLRTVSANSR